MRVHYTILPTFNTFEIFCCKKSKKWQDRDWRAIQQLIAKTFWLLKSFKITTTTKVVAKNLIFTFYFWSSQQPCESEVSSHFFWWETSSVLIGSTSHHWAGEEVPGSKAAVVYPVQHCISGWLMTVLYSGGSGKIEKWEAFWSFLAFSHLPVKSC